MDKQVILSVAGSGKTSFIINNLDINSKAIIISYTIANTENIKSRVIDKFGYLPKNIKIFTYFSFLFSFCFKPLFSRKLEIENNMRVKGITYKSNPNFKIPKSSISHYISSNCYVYSNRLSKLIMKIDSKNEVFSRLENYFDAIYIDEIQDFGGNDFNFITNFSKLNMKVIFVGDFYQHTFDTSADGNTNKSLFLDYDKYIAKFKNSGFNVDTTSLSKSYRCTSIVCDFITQSLGITIYSNNSKNSKILEIDDSNRIKELLSCKKTVKLFYQEHQKFYLYSNNWGNSKGLDCYNDICIILNKKSYKLYKEDKLIELPSVTKNKLYVACTRSKNDIFFVSENNFLKNIS